MLPLNAGPVVKLPWTVRVTVLGCLPCNWSKSGCMAVFRKQNRMSWIPLPSASETNVVLVQLYEIWETEPVPAEFSVTVHALMSVTWKLPLMGSTCTHHMPEPDAN